MEIKYVSISKKIQTSLLWLCKIIWKHEKSNKISYRGQEEEEEPNIFSKSAVNFREYALR